MAQTETIHAEKTQKNWVDQRVDKIVASVSANNTLYIQGAALKTIARKTANIYSNATNIHLNILRVFNC